MSDDRDKGTRPSSREEQSSSVASKWIRKTGTIPAGASASSFHGQRLRGATQAGTTARPSATNQPPYQRGSGASLGNSSSARVGSQVASSSGRLSSSARQTRTKTIHPSPTYTNATSVGHRRSLDSVPTPSRVRFAQLEPTNPSRPSQLQSSSKTTSPASKSSVPARKVGSQGFARRIQQPPSTAEPISTRYAAKDARPLLPLWQQREQERERVTKRARYAEMGRVVRWVSATAGRRDAATNDSAERDIEHSGRIRAQVGPNLALHANGVPISASSEEEDEAPRGNLSSRRMPRKSIGGEGPKRQLASKSSAARKTTAPSSGSEDDSSGVNSPRRPLRQATGGRGPIRQLASQTAAARKTEIQYTTPSGSSNESPEDSDSRMDVDSTSSEGQLDESRGRQPFQPGSKRTSIAGPVIYGAVTEDSIEEPRPESPQLPERDSSVEIIEYSPPAITIALPQIKAEPETEPTLLAEPSDELLDAVEALSLSTIRLQATRPLPFLRRNLRQGFRRRCADLHVPIYRDTRTIFLSIRYQYVDGIIYETEVDDWLCPLCGILGSFGTREMMHCHLQWDHQDVVVEWDKVEDHANQQRWQVQILIPEPPANQGGSRGDQDEDVEEDEEEEVEAEQDDELQSRSRTPDFAERTPAPQQPPAFSSPLPFVTISPPSVRQPVPVKVEVIGLASGVALKREQIEEEDFSPTTKDSRLPAPSATPSSSRPSGQPDSLSRGRSTTDFSLGTATTTTLRTAATTTTDVSTTTERPPGDTRYPTPPPPDNPLGPSARYPYLPATSEYGGPTVYYSCRPGGPFIYDLLGTLPLKEFGLLEWEVLDREEEIYDLDDMKDEHKVMHALWARWIVNHRNEFIANYYEGTLAFVKYYWRMIHRAAGWEALRHWLLILLVNQFLNGHDVAQVLLRYQELTGMASWYD